MVKKIHRLCFLLLPLCLMLAVIWLLPVSADSSQQRAQANLNTPTFQINTAPVITDVKSFGINIGAHDRYGASQILKNIIINPGLEAGEFQMIFIAKEGPTVNSVKADNIKQTWEITEVITNGQPVGFWDNATYRVILGETMGATGRVVSFTHENQRQTFHLSPTIPVSGDVVVVSRQITDTIGGCCRYTSYVPDTNERRPGSLGNQSLRATQPITPNWYSYSYYMDSYGNPYSDLTAGKLLHLHGEWLLTFWAKPQFVGKRLTVRLHRAGLDNILVQQTITLTNENWTKISIPISLTDSADSLSDPATTLMLSMNSAGGAGDFWLDDLSFARVGETNPTVFSDRFVNYLKELQPGIVRNWGDRQLGSTLDNQLAPIDGRKTQGWKPTESGAHYFHFSLGEFLALAREVEAEPWYVIPPTFTDQEMTDLAAYLAAPYESGHPYAELRATHGQTATWTSVFPTIHLEFGNEMWGDGWGNDPFQGATVSGGINVGKLASTRFAAFDATAFSTANINRIIGGQTRYPVGNQRIEANSDAHDMLALSPYFGQIGEDDSSAETYYPLFADAIYQTTVADNKSMLMTLQLLEQRPTKPAIYEINFHTTKSDATVDERNQFVAGMGGGLALPLHMLTYLRDFGIREQVAYSMLQYSFRVEDLTDDPSRTPAWFEHRAYDSTFNDPVAASRLNEVRQYVRVWGMLRDLEATGRKRPTWLGLELINPHLSGDMIQVVGQNIPTVTVPAINGLTTPIELPLVQGFAFKDDETVSMLLFNLSLTETITVDLNLPAPATRSTVDLHVLSSDFITSNNELAEDVQIETVSLLVDADTTVTLAPHSMAGFAYISAEIPTAISIQENQLTSNGLFLPITLILVLLCAVSVKTLVTNRRVQLQSQNHSHHL